MESAATPAADLLFSALDADGDGVITREEMREGLAGAAVASRGRSRDRKVCHEPATRVCGYARMQMHTQHSTYTELRFTVLYGRRLR